MSVNRSAIFRSSGRFREAEEAVNVARMTATGALAVPLRSTLATHHIGENAEGDARECVKGCYSQAHTDQEPILHHRGDDVQPEHQRGGDPHEDDTAARSEERRVGKESVSKG